MSRGRIAVLIPEVYDTLDKEFLTGVQTTAAQLGLDTLVFTSVSSEATDGYICGENNIYELPFLTKLDGIIMAANRFRSESLRRRVLEQLRSSGIPCVAVEHEYEGITGVFLDQSSSIHSVTEHLIKEHGLRDILCLTGPENNREALERAQGYERAMNQYALSDNIRIVYGDFWRNSAIKLMDDILVGRLRRPEAIVCTNDIMAITLCQELPRYGVRVPEDIAVTGYDGSVYTLITRPAVTTVCGGDNALGRLAVKALAEKLGLSCDTGENRVYLRTCGSCGCFDIGKEKEVLLRQTEKLLHRQLERKNFIFTNYIARMSDCESIPKFTSVLDSLRYVMSECSSMSICLCEDWRVEMPEYRRHGYSERMELIYSENQPGQLMFPLRTLLPQLEHPHEPQFWVFSSLHYTDRVIGYIATSYDTPEQFAVDEHYIGWCDAVANGLDIVIKKSNTEYIWQKLEEKNMSDMHTGLLSRRGFLAKISEGDSVLLMSFPQGCGDMQYFVSITSAVIRSERSEVPAVYLGERVFAIALRDESGQQLASDICRSLTDVGIYITVNELSLLSFRAGVTADEQLTQMYSSLTEKNVPRSSEAYSDIFTELRREMRYSPQGDWSINTAAARSGMSGSHFQRLYKKFFGVSFNEELISFRLDRAKYLLVNTSLPIQQVAEDCGYTCCAHFMRQFRDRVGVSAGSYRKAEKNG